MTIVDTIRTVGHGTLTAEEFVAVARNAGVEGVVDVRRFPGSRRHPHFAGREMATWLLDHGVDYRWLPSLGGRRKCTGVAERRFAQRPVPRLRRPHDLRRVRWRGRGSSRPGEARPVAVMCAELVWWRCHRRLLADHLVLVEQLRVEHLFHDGRLVEHAPMPEARRVDHHVVYDVGTQRPLPPGGQ